MKIESIPILVFFLIVCIIVVVSIEIGYLIGNSVHKKSVKKRELFEEKESPVSGISGSVLGLLVFILVFTFSIVSERYDNKRRLVREEANAIRTAWFRTDFLPEPDRGKSKELLKEYVAMRSDVIQAAKSNQMKELMAKSTKIQDQLFDIAVVNARKDMNSDVAALYIESLNEMINFHFERVSIGLQVRIPNGIWLILFVLMVFSMFTVGYQTAIANSSRTWLSAVLAISFSLVVTLIAVLDRPQTDFLTISQQSMIDLNTYINQEMTQKK